MSTILDRYGNVMVPTPANFEGATFNRARISAPVTVNDSKVLVSQHTRRVMLGRARWLFNNVGFVKGAVTDMARYSVGTGYIPQSQIQDQGIRAEYEAYWRQWSEICEVTGRLTFTEILRLASMAIDVDGDIGVILAATETDYPQLALVESHRIASKYNDAAYMDGVQTDQRGRPIAYSVQDGDSIYGSENYKPIEARNFCLLSELDRCDEQRGKTRLHAAITRLIDVWETLESETLAIKTNSKIALAIKTSLPGSQPFFGKQRTVGDPGTGESTTEQIFAGAMPRLQQGEEITSYQSDRPNPTFTGYLDYLGRDVAVGLGLPFEFIWNAEKVGGATQRFVLQKAQRRFDERQATLTKFAKRIWGWVVSKAVKRGDLPQSDDWWKVRWQMPSKITVDVGREAREAREDILLGLRTVSEDAAERGLDVDELRDQTEKEALDLITRADRLEKATGKPFDLCLSLLSRRTPNGNLPTAPVAPTEPPNETPPPQP